MKSALELVVAVAATQRITQLVVEDEVSRPVREFVTSRWPDSRVEYLVNCKACVSVWAGALVASGLLPKPVLSALAASSGTLAAGWVADSVAAVTQRKV